MFVWFAAASVWIVWAVFRSPAVDYRTVALGSVVGLVSVPFGVTPLDTLAAPVVVLGVVMVATIGHRLRRRRWLGLPIGMFLHLVLDGSWMDPDVFWWPAGGIDAGRASFVVSRGVWSLVLELAGIMIALYLYERFGLSDPGRRRRFVRTGQLDRSFVLSDRPPQRQPDTSS